MKSALRAFTILVAATAMGFVACSKGGDGGNPAPAIAPFQYYGAPGCMTCTNPSQGLLASAVSQDPYTGAEMDLQFYGDPQILMMTQGYAPAGYSQGYMQQFPTGAYRGGFAASGGFYLPMGLPQCGLPPGRFQLQTTTPGIWGNDGAGRSGENVTMMLVGAPVQVIVYMSGFTMPAAPAARGQDGNQYPYRFQTTTLVVKRADSPYTCQLFMQ